MQVRSPLGQHADGPPLQVIGRLLLASLAKYTRRVQAWPSSYPCCPPPRGVPAERKITWGVLQIRISVRQRFLAQFESARTTDVSTCRSGIVQYRSWHSPQLRSQRSLRLDVLQFGEIPADECVASRLTLRNGCGKLSLHGMAQYELRVFPALHCATIARVYRGSRVGCDVAVQREVDQLWRTLPEEFDEA